ncbi:Serine/Threonine kinase domain protein [Diplonema papillatum]|nr:Serine/Threonine kinase domain protein [Diplonema papillatum]
MESPVPALLADVKLEDIPRDTLVAEINGGAVWACLIEGKLYALKGIASDHPSSYTLLQELEALRVLKAPGIPALVKTFRADGMVFILKRFACGCTVEKLFYASQSLNPDLALHVVKHLAAILNVVHESGFVYRDLKANNVVVDKTGEVFLIDYGLCTKKGGSSTFCGAYHTRAPELLDAETSGASLPDSSKLDCWALGILLWEMLSGKPPFGYPLTLADMNAAMQQGLPRLPCQHDSVNCLLLGLLTKDADNRLSAADVLEHAALASHPLEPRNTPHINYFVEEVEMQTLGMDETVAPPSKWC